ncbi:winged helix-turn-helix domain-containing protein [Aureimonas psammosilenae]|uniref:winged helix-turn-helix domain-containing protein n=1 Tax=Aureimonas psammosilenae TaxID=2495496 RepID=UPI001260ECE1|nr:crosslink repair DNA glycosylase YcaQ family protein [Aureimonas psammosilenae]
MTAAPRNIRALTRSEARRIWLRAQRLDEREPFGGGLEAVPLAVRHLGYVQIDTINVIERSHHHILWTRIPSYKREHLVAAQSVERSLFEYWTHALSYVPTEDYRFFMPAMRRHRQNPNSWFSSVSPKDLAKVMRLVREGGALSIREIEDDVLVEKDHAWASRKPSKRALQLAFYTGALTISARSGMLKSYELAERHFGWETRPRPATETQTLDYMLDRALRSQGVVSLDSICHLVPSLKSAVRGRIETRLRRRSLVPVVIDGAEKVEHWATPEALEDGSAPDGEPMIHLLSPFDPLVIQRRRLAVFFGYEHRFEAYVPKEKRLFGYFALPVLLGDRIVAALDLKTDRLARRLLIQKATWFEEPSVESKARIDDELGRFERFQLES